MANLLRPAVASRALRHPRCLNAASITHTRISSSSIRQQHTSPVHNFSIAPMERLRTCYCSQRPTSTPCHSRYSSSSSSSSSSSTSTPLGSVSQGAAGLSSTLQPPTHLDEKEAQIFHKLNKALSPVKLEVQDISGGCGSMYGIEIVSERFRGLNMLKQQRLVNEVLGEDIKGWHGVQLKTMVP